MSTTVDERVVSMEFDNRQFERNTKTTMKTLDNLNKSLELKGASKGLEGVNTAAKRISFSPISTGIEKIQMKFSALQVMAVTALSNITNSAVNMGKNLVKAFTIDPIQTGLSEYETQINAVQTILANTSSKGTTLDDVNSALDELNTYADKTIYNFTEMTRNIGTFTAAGVDLDKSVSSIKGIANLAAVSGSSSQQASTAMYQLSQALATGKVSLMDWNSVVNAGMGGQLFQDALKRTAKHMGKDVDGLIATYGSFRESLSQGDWLTADVLTETLTQLSGAYSEADLMAQGYTESQAKEITKLAETAVNAATDVKTFTQLMDTLKETAQSGWTQTWEILIGDFEEAKSLWSNVYKTLSPMIDAMSQARNEMLLEWADMGGRDSLMESFKNSFEGIKSIIAPIKEAFNEVFPPMTAQRLFEITENLKEMTSKFKIGGEQAEQLKSIFKGLFSSISIGLSLIKAIAGPILKFLWMIINAILGGSAKLGEWVDNLRVTIEETNIFGRAVEKVTGFLSKMAEKTSEVASSTKAWFKAKMDTPGYERFLSVVNGIWEVFKAIGAKIAKFTSAIGKAFADVFGSGSMNEALNFFVSLFNSGLVGALLLTLNKFAGSLKDLGGSAREFKESFMDIFGGVTDCLSALQNQIQSKTLMNIAIAVGILAASLFVLATIDPEALTSALTAITLMFVELMAAMKVFVNIIDGSKVKVNKFAFSLILISTAIVILASAVKKLASLSWKQLAVGLTGVAGLLAMLLGFTAALNKMGGKVAKGSIGLILLAAALTILTDVVMDLSALSWGELGRGITGLAGMLILLTGASIALSKTSSKMVKGSVGLVLMGAALEILTDVLFKLSTLSWSEMAKGFVALAGMLGILLGMSIALSKTHTKMASAGLGLVIFAAGVEILADALGKMGAMKWAEIAKGLILLAGALGVISAFAITLNKTGSHLVATGLGIVIFAAGVEILADALGKMGQMGIKEIGKSLLLLAGTLILIGGLAVAMHATGAHLGATSMSLLVFASAISILAPALSSLGKMKWSSIAKGLATIASIFVILGLAALILRPLVPVITKLSLSMMLLGIGMAMVGTGLAIFAAGLTSLGVAIGFAGGAILGITEQATRLIPIVTRAVGQGILLFAQIIAEGAPELIKAVVILIGAICQAFVEAIPMILDAIVQILGALVDYLPQIVDRIVDLIIALFDTLKTRIPELVVAAADFIAAFFGAIFDVLGDIGTENVKKIAEAVLILASSCLVLSAVGSAGMGAVIGVGVLLLLIAALGALMIGIGALMDKFPQLEEFVDKAMPVLQKIGFGLGSFIGGIVGGFATGAMSGLPQMGLYLSEFMTNLKPFLDGASSLDPEIMKGVLALAGVILALTAADVLNGLTSWITGGSSITEFGEQLAPFGESIAAFSDAVAGKIDAEAVEAAANAGKVMAEMARALPNTGGVAGFFAGNNDMDVFGEQLVVFGESIATFSATVAGKIDAEAVVAAANAGKVMAEMADSLPNTGGVAGFFAGNNDMDTFGEQLVVFGKSIAAFSKSVVGLDVAAVEGAATAGKMMAEMADTIPNTGGVVSWFTGNNDMDTFGEQLVPFGRSMKEFSNEVTGLDTNAITGAATAGKMLAELADALPNSGGVASWFAGENEIDEFGPKLIPFGKAMKEFSDEVVGVNPEAVEAAANAGKIMARMAETLPNTGGVAGFFAGENDMDLFTDQIVPFGKAMKEFSDEVKGIDSAAVESATNAGIMMARMAETLPNTGGVAGFFAGNNDMGEFSDQIVPFGKAMKEFSNEVAGLNVDAVNAAASAGKMMSEMATTIPNTGGVVSFFAGDNDLETFSEHIVLFGTAMKEFSDEVIGIDSEAVTGAASAGKMMAELVAALPNTGGFGALFAGDQDMEDFTSQLGPFGEAMKEFSNAVTGIDTDAVTTAADAGKTIALMSNNGTVMTDFLNGDMDAFATNLGSFGSAIKGFSDKVFGINTYAVSNAITAGNDLITMASGLPDTGGLSNFFSGQNDLGAFSENIVIFGSALVNFSNTVEGVSSDSVAKAATAGTSLVEMANQLPTTGGVKGFFSGESNMDTFSAQVEKFGNALLNFSDSVIGVDAAAVANATTAGKSLVELYNELPKIGGFFGSGGEMTEFATEIVAFGKGIRGFSNAVVGVDSEKTANATIAGGSLIELTTKLPKSGRFGDIDMNDFADQMTAFGEGIGGFSAAVAGVDSENVTSTSGAARSIIDLYRTIPEKMDISGFTENLNPFGKAIRNFADTISSIDTAVLSANAEIIKNTSEMLSEVGKTSVDGFIEAFRSPEVGNSADSMIQTAIKSVSSKSKDFSEIGKTLMDNFADGMNSKKANVLKSLSTLVASAVTSTKAVYYNFYDAGSHLVSGFASGIGANAWKATSQAAAMARASLQAVNNALDINSPSKEFYKSGNFSVDGFVNAFSDRADDSYDAGFSIAERAKSGLSKAISRVKGLIENGVDSQPTIRPVLDLSNVTDGVGAIGNMFNMNPSIGVMSNIRSIGSMMNNKNQNGANDDVIAAISDLKGAINTRSGDVYNLGNISYDDGSNISEAVQTLVRAVMVERRK